MTELQNLEFPTFDGRGTYIAGKTDGHDFTEELLDLGFSRIPIIDDVYDYMGSIEIFSKGDDSIVCMSTAWGLLFAFHCGSELHKFECLERMLKMMHHHIDLVIMLRKDRAEDY